MNCPRCQKPHERGDYGPRPELKPEILSPMPWAPPDVLCDCGALLRVTVPLFKADAYGWHWKIL